MTIRNTLIDAYGLNSPGVNLLDHAGNHDYSGFYPANQTQNIQINYDNINNYIHITQNSDSRVGAYRAVNNIEPGKIYNLSFYVYSENSGILRNCFETSTEEYGSNLTFNSNEWSKCWVTSKAVNKNIVFYVQNTSFKIRNIKLTECTKKDCYFFQYTDINDESKPFVYNFKDLQTNCRYTEYFANDNPINELISWENFKYPLKEFVEREEWQYSNDKSYRTRNTTSIIDWCDGSNKSSVSNTEREDATIEYGTPELTLVVDDIPASGGTISDGTVSYGQSKYYVYSDTRFKITDESGIITEGLTWGDSVTAQSLGTTIKNRSIVGSLSVSTTINGKTESTTVDVYQQANRIESYGIPTGRTLSVSDIPASGGTVSRGTLGGTITQSCTYTSGSNGTLTNPTITSSSYSNSITADSLGTTIKDRTKIGTLTYTYVCNKRTGSISADVYQQANNATDITYGDWNVSLSANKYTISSSPAPAGGGTVAITSSASRTRIQNYTSGATSKLSNETVSPSLSVTGSGFTLNGATVTVANRTNVEGAARTGSVTATYGGVSKSIALYQAENKLVATSATGSASIGTVLNVYATGGKVTWSPVVEYSSGWNGAPPSGVTITYSLSNTNLGATQNGNVTTWPNRDTTIGKWREVNVNIHASSSYTTTPVLGTVSTGQNMNTVTAISIVNGSGGDPRTECPASGGICEIFPKFTFSSGSSGFSLEYSKLGEWSGSATGFTITNVDSTSSSGIDITAASRGTAIGNDRSITVTYLLNTTINGVAINKSATHKYTQEGNYVESISISGGTFSYDSILASDTSASPTITGSSVYFNFTSGSKSGTAPSSTYGTYSSSASYTLGSVINGFTSVSQYSGTLTATNRGTTIGPSRTSGTVTRKITVTWTPVSSYNSAGTKTDSLSLTAACTQALNKVESCTETGNTLSYPSIAAAGGTSTPSSTATATFKYSSGASGNPSGYTKSSSYSMTSGNGFSINTSTGIVTATNNTTTSSRKSNTITRTTKFSYTNPASVGGDTVSATLTKTATCTQSAGVKTYANPVVSLSYGDIPASGGTVSPTYSYSQTWGWNGATSGGGTITSGGTLKWTGCTDNATGRCSASTKGTVISTRSSVAGSATLTVTLNGKSGSKSTAVYQALNTITSFTYVKGNGGSPTTSFAASASAHEYYPNFTFSSGSVGLQKTYSNEVDYSISGTGFSLGDKTNATYSYGQTVKVASRGTTIGAARTGTLIGTLNTTINGVAINESATLSLTQALNTITSIKIMGTGPSTPLTSLSATANTPGYTGVATFSTGIETELNNYESYVSYSFNQSWGTWISSGYYGVLKVASRGTTIGAARSGVLTCTVKGTINSVSVNKSGTLTITQALNKMTSITEVKSNVTYSPTTLSAAGGNSTPSYTGNCTLKFSSGASTTYQSSGWSGMEISRSWSLSSTTGFSINTNSGVVTAASRGTTIGAARSTTANAKLTFSYTNPSTVGGGTVTGTDTDNITITQAENTVTSSKIVPMSGLESDVNFPASGASRAFIGEMTLSSGAKIQGSDYKNYITYSLTSSFGTFTPNAEKYYGIVTVASRGGTIGVQKSGTLTHKISGTINGVSINKTATLALTQAINTITSIRILSAGPSTPVTSLSATANTPGYTGVATFSTGIETELNNYESYVSYSFNQSWGTWISSGYYGVLKVASRGTTIGAARSGVLTCTVKGTINSVSVNKSGTLTITQALNKMTALSIIPSSGATDTTSYPTGNFAASGGTKTPTKSSRVDGTFSSGSHGYTDAAGAWYGGTLTTSRAWSMATATGFSMNTSNGVVTASNRGTTEGAARTCNPKCVISASFTNPSSVGGGVVKATSATDSFTLTQTANSMTRDYSDLVGHISSTTWANKANYTSFWAEGSYIERYTSGATGASGTGSVPWDSVTFGGADWVYYDSVQGILKWYDNTGLERSTTVTGRIGSWTYSVKVTQKAGMSIGRLYLHVPVNVGYIGYWNIYVNSTSGGQIWSGHPDESGSANNILKMPEECAIIVAQNGGTVSFSTTYSTATDRNYRGSISGTEQDRLADGEDVTVYLT